MYQLVPIYAKLSEHLGVNQEQLMISSGIDGCIKTLFEILVNPMDLVGVFSPTYAMYSVYSDLYSASLYHISYSNELMPNWDKFDDFLDLNPGLFLPNPNQPIESCFGLEKLSKLLKDAFQSAVSL